MHRSIRSGRAFQAKRYRHRQSVPTGRRSSIILYIIQKLTIFFELSLHVPESPSQAGQQPFLFPRSRDTELAIMRSIFVAPYAFAILLGMIGIAGPPMVLRRLEAHADQHGLLLR